MAAEQRKLLEQLMGAETLQYMPGTTPKQQQLSITDSKVCRPYICGACPHDLFTNTKGDLGQCPKVHQGNLKEDWEAASEQQKREWGFEFDYHREILRHVRDCDSKIDLSQKRLEKTPDEIRQTNTLLKSISDYTRNLETGMVEVEVLAEDGAVNLAVQEFHKLKIMRVQKDEKERDLKSLSDTSGPSGHQKLQVCDVCGAYLSRLDNDRRLADHFFGKMHLGYAQMRRENERLNKELKGKAPPIRYEDPEAHPGNNRYDDNPYGDGRGGRGYGGGYGGRGGGGGWRGGGGGGFGRRGRGSRY
ncbi:putative U1 snRNP splicing complex subunit [Polychaeton citri CBS 116435]|uniref:U1 snRNP splicing complex subunit n=1 Tax=Polychaeton citri CBS 116435 TaxID=1314669 RepID=A0A9P4Q5J2_9PEZI|nr:putative U1 snRNP splicing complex subunit [Polychaeton citri CBS 116435]